MDVGEILLRRGLVDDRQLERSREQQTNGSSIVDVAVELGFVSEEAALRAIADEIGLDYVDSGGNRNRFEFTVEVSTATDLPRCIVSRTSRERQPDRCDQQPI